jgi:adenylate kinase family enzyme
MNKIVIIGSPGAGKSTLARKLKSILKIQIVHLDRIFWQRGWEEKPRDTRIDILQDLVRHEQWIIEGTYLGSSEPRLNAADIIIFLDINPLICLLRVIKRHHEYRGLTRRDIPMESTDRLTMYRMLKVLVFPLQDRRTLKQKLRNCETKQIIWLRSSEEVEDFLAQLETHTYEKKQTSKMPPVAGKRQLGLVGR